MKFVTLAICLAGIIIPEILGINLTNNDLVLHLDADSVPITFNLTLGGAEKVVGALGVNLTLSDLSCTNSACESTVGPSIFQIKPVDDGFNILWLSNDTQVEFNDCIDLDIGELNWFGGQERLYSKWPIETLNYTGQAYRSTQVESGAVADRYWLNSRGAYITVDARTPLFLEQNSKVNGSLCLVAKAQAPYLQRNRVLLNYNITALSDAREAHSHAVQNFLGKPTGHPNEWIIREPIWTTWAKYKTNISDEIVVEFAQDISNHGFIGQLEIDDKWETCYGSAVFNERFSNINSTVSSLKSMNFTVTLWTHPFIDDNCEAATEEARRNGYLVKSLNGSDFTVWWNSNSSHHIDYTNPAAAQWQVDRLRLLQQKHGIDAFKFDAGENDWAPEVANLTGDPELAPNSLTEVYLRTAAQFGDLIEVRSASNTQDLPVFVRMIDKDSKWGLDNGLHSLITTLLQMNLNGYTLVLPDMIGGNGYNPYPTAELLVRWTQANVFMPSMQFSYLPWEFTNTDFDTTAIVRKFVDLHRSYSDEILKAMRNSIENGTPVNPPIWWVDPANPDALAVNDEFLLGENILVAPVIEAGANYRDVYLPAGTWVDGNTGDVWNGPINITNFPAPIDVLPFFIRQ